MLEPGDRERPETAAPDQTQHRQDHTSGRHRVSHTLLIALPRLTIRIKNTPSCDIDDANFLLLHEVICLPQGLLVIIKCLRHHHNKSHCKWAGWIMVAKCDNKQHSHSSDHLLAPTPEWREAFAARVKGNYWDDLKVESGDWLRPVGLLGRPS
jgi:hypothetical protein